MSLTLGEIAQWAIEHHAKPEYKGCSVNCSHSIAMVKDQIEQTAYEAFTATGQEGTLLAHVRIEYVLSKVGSGLNRMPPWDAARAESERRPG